ncbi:hypothetical protein D3C85_1226040 [compost metagenome]
MPGRRAGFVPPVPGAPDRHGPDDGCASLRGGPGRHEEHRYAGRCVWPAEFRWCRRCCCADRSDGLAVDPYAERLRLHLVPERLDDGRGPGFSVAEARSRHGYRSCRYRRPGTRPVRDQRRRVERGAAVHGLECLHAASAQGARHGWRPVFPCPPCPCPCPCDRHHRRSDRRREGHVGCAGYAHPDARVLPVFPLLRYWRQNPSGRRRRFSVWSCARCFSAVFLRPVLPARWLRPNDRHGRYGRYGARSLRRRSAVRS